MKILLLAPQPFFEERGTPIAVNLLLRLLSEQGHRVDLLTFHLGQNVAHKNLTVFRTAPLSFIQDIRPGLSWKKIVCDALMLFKVFSIVRRRRPQVLHAVEESVFMALLIKVFFRIPYVYDMDSSLVSQIKESHGFLGFLQPLLRFMEGLAINHAMAVLPVCPALVDMAKQHKPKHLALMTDTSLLDPHSTHAPLKLREALGTQGDVFMYIGNLEPYQGIDLLLEAFTRVHAQTQQASLIVVGGMPQLIEAYTAQADRLGILTHVHFIGPKPMSLMAALFDEADVLVSPRCAGVNTPMKLYSYLDSGKPVLATALPTHTQVLDASAAKLADPTPEAFAAAMLELIQCPDERTQIGMRGKQLVEKEFSVAAASERLRTLYAHIESELAHAS